MRSEGPDRSIWEDGGLVQAIDGRHGLAPGSTRPRRILVVDDDDGLRQALKEGLEDYGYEAQEADDGHVALETLRRWQPDAIVLDLNMPHLDGWSFRVQQRLNPHWALIPVVVMTADDGSKARAVDGHEDPGKFDHRGRGHHLAFLGVGG